MSNKKRVDAEQEGDDSAEENTPAEEDFKLEEEVSCGEDVLIDEEVCDVKEGDIPEEVCCVCGSVENIKRCANCKSTHYCSKKCQKSHLDHHTKYCSTIADLKKLETEKLYGNKTVRQKHLDFKTQKKLVKLIGQKPILNCQLDDKAFKMLWDTGSQVSLVDRSWVREHFPDEEVYSVSEFLEDKELNLRAANATIIPFDGVIILKFSLLGGEEGFYIPVLVASESIPEPILGYNVIETLILHSPDQQDALQKSLVGQKGSCGIEALVALVQQKANDPDFLTEVKTSAAIKVPAGHRVKIRCRVKAQGQDKETAYFSPALTNSEEDLTFSETVCDLRRGRTNYVTVDIMNHTNTDRTLGKGSVIGSVHTVSAVLPMVNMWKGAAEVESRKEKGEKVEGAVREESKEGVGATIGSVTTETKETMWDLSHLQGEAREMVEKVLIEEQDVFAKDEHDIGMIPDFQLKINLTDNIPTTAAYRRIPPNLYSEVRNYIDDLVNNGWIRESFSSYSSPIVCVRKKDGGLRMCCDYRKLNLKTIPDAQPIPRIQDIFDKLGGKKWFSTLDMAKAYHQGFIAEECRHLTAFTTPWTLYEWVRIPFGLRNAPPGFQRFITQALGDLKGLLCEPYLDDVLVFAETLEEHVKHLKKVLYRLRMKGVKLRADKCCFAKEEVRYLGRLVSSNGYRPDPEDTAALEKFRDPPKNVGELRSVLGFLGYYRGYVKDFSRKVKPLYELLQKDGESKGKGKSRKEGKEEKASGQKYDPKEKIVWEERHQVILEELIDYLKSPEVIAFPNFDLPFFITTDASNQGLGSVLYQTQDGVDRVVSYASRTLSEAEKNYHFHSGKLEFLGLKWAVTERFADYLRYHHQPFVVYTDNNPLTYVLTSAKLNAIGMRWVNELADFNFTIKYRPGKENVDADYLSRRPMDISELKRGCSESVDPRCMDAVVSGLRHKGSVVSAVSASNLVLKPDEKVISVSKEELAEKQKHDDIIGPVYRAVLIGCRPKRKEWAELSQESRLLMRNFGKLRLRDGVLLRYTTKFSQIVLPKEMYQLVYTELHEKMAHLGVEKVVNLAQQRFYWPRMASDIKDYIQKKCRCIVNKKPNSHERAPLVPIQAMYPFQMVSLDYMKLDQCKGKFQYALVITDHFTRFAQVYGTKSKSSRAAADKLYNEFVMQYGFPERIHSDQGGEFNSNLFKDLHRISGIKASRTTPYHPEGDGQTERFNRTLCNMLKSLKESEKKDWKKHLPKLAFAYNSTVNKSTGFSPFYLMFGRESKLPIDLVFQEIRDMVEVNNGQTHEQFAKEWEQSMLKAFEVARENIGKSAQYNKRYFDKKAKAVEMEIGDAVLVKNDREKGGTGKLKSWWVEAIFKVVEKMDGLPVYKVKNIRKSRDIRVLHRNKLMRCNDLPLNIFKEEEKDVKRNVAKKSALNKLAPMVVHSSESDDEDLAIAVYVEDSEHSERDQSQLDAVSDVLDDSDAVLQRDEVIQNTVDNDSQDSSEDIAREEIEEDTQGDEGDDIESSDTESDETEDGEEVGRSTRARFPRKIFTIKTLGGNPSMEIANSHIKQRRGDKT